MFDWLYSGLFSLLQGCQHWLWDGPVQAHGCSYENHVIKSSLCERYLHILCSISVGFLLTIYTTWPPSYRPKRNSWDTKHQRNNKNVGLYVRLRLYFVPHDFQSYFDKDLRRWNNAGMGDFHRWRTALLSVDFTAVFFFLCQIVEM